MTYKNAPFVEWCDHFFSEIHREVNDIYELLFVGTEFEAEIMKKLAEKDSYCKSFDVSDSLINHSIFDRLATIEKLTDENNCLLTVSLFSEDDSLAQAMFGILEESGTFVSESDKTATCSDCPLVNIVIEKASLTNFLEDGDSSLNLILTNQIPDDDFIDKYDNYDKATFVFYIGTTSFFEKKVGNVFIYSVDADSLSDYLLRIIIGYSLCGILSEKSYQMQKAYESGVLVMTDEEYALLEKICLISPIYKANIPTELYKGRSCEININECPEISECQYLLESDNNDIIKIVGMQLIAISSGTAEIKIFKEGESDVLLSGKVKVIDAILIDRIEIFPRNKSIKENMEDSVEVTIYPETAANFNEIQWSTSDPNIAYVTNTKTIFGVSCGSCELTISAGAVTGNAKIEVMPSLKDIFCPTSVVTLAVGEQVEWKYVLIPENCYERDLIKIWSSDEKVAAYMGGYIIGKSVGTANISVYTSDNQIKKNCLVTVSKKKLFG